MPKRERDLYRYRPEDAEAQQRDRERMQERREQELKGISEQWDESLRDRLKEPEASPTPGVIPGGHRRRRRTRLGKLLDRLAKAMGIRREAKSSRGGAHRKA
jgi:hypothetical protein